jgi:hypothetical protein
MLNIYTDHSYVTEKDRNRLFPLLRELFLRKKSELQNYFQIVEYLEQAEIIIIPLDINFFFEHKKEEELWALINKAKTYAKPIWVYSSGDIGKSIKAPVYTFRLGGFHTKLDKNTLIIPAFIQDPYVTFLNKKFQPLKKEENPAIGFAGHANGSPIKWFKELLVFVNTNIKRCRTNYSFDFQPFFPSGKKRYNLLMNLVKDPFIITDFIFRKRYRAGAKTPEVKKRTTLEFYANIERTPYTLCVRGAGNFSIRLYEVLAMGRIPVLVNSNFRLPLPWLNWNSHCLITDRKNLRKTLHDFHNSCTPEEFINVQKSNKNLWREKLSLEGFFIEIHDFFKKSDI